MQMRKKAHNGHGGAHHSGCHVSSVVQSYVCMNIAHTEQRAAPLLVGKRYSEEDGAEYRCRSTLIDIIDNIA